MAITLLHAPDRFALTKAGRMNYQFSGNARTQSAGAKAINQVAFTNCPDGTPVILTWNGRSYTYTARTNPTTDTEFLAGNGNSAHVDALLSFFATRYEIREDFTLTRGTVLSVQTIVLTAKQTGPNYNLTPYTGINGTFTTGISTVNVTPGVAAVLRANYGVHAEVWLEKSDGSSFDRIYVNTLEADESGLSLFDVGSVLHAQFWLDWPNFVVAQPNLNPHSVRRYYLAFGEAYGSPQQIGAIQQGDILYACYGGADYLARSGAGFSLITFLETVAAQQDWAMRFGSPTRYVRPDEPQFLSFLNTRASAQNITLEVLLTYDNDQQQLISNLVAPTAWPLGQKLTMPVGPAQLALAIQSGDGVHLREYSVRLKQDNTSNYFSTSYRYILNYAYQPYTRYFAYETSLGVVDTLATFGKGSAELQRFFEQAEQFLPAAYVPTDGQFVDYDVTLQQQVQVTTGYRAEAELKAWNDFYRAPRRVLVRPDVVALPISLVSKSIKQSKDGDSQFAHVFEYLYSFQDSFYTGNQSLDAGDPTPPPIFTPAGGQLVIQPTVTLFGYDATVPPVARELTQEVVTDALQAHSWGNHANAGYLDQQAATGLFPPKAFFDDVIAAAGAGGGGGGLQLLAVDPSAGKARIAAQEEVTQLVGSDGLASLVTGLSTGQGDAILAQLLAGATDATIRIICTRLAAIDCGSGPDTDILAFGQHYEALTELLFGQHYEAIVNPVVTPPVLAPDLVVYVQENGCFLITGYAYDRNHPDVPQAVDIFDNHQLVATITATNTRPDIATQIGGKASSLYGWVWMVPASLRDTTSHIRAVYARDTSVAATFGQSPTTPVCGQPPAPYIVQRIVNGPISIAEGGAAGRFYVQNNYSDGTSQRSTQAATWSIVEGKPAGLAIAAPAGAETDMTLSDIDTTKRVTVRATFADGTRAQDAIVELINTTCHRPAVLAKAIKLAYNYQTTDGIAHLFTTLDDANQTMGKIFNESGIGITGFTDFKAEMADYNVGTEVFINWQTEGDTSCAHVANNIYYVLSGDRTDGQKLAIQVVDGRIAAVKVSTYAPPRTYPIQITFQRLGDTTSTAAGGVYDAELKVFSLDPSVSYNAVAAQYEMQNDIEEIGGNGGAGAGPWYTPTYTELFGNPWGNQAVNATVLVRIRKVGTTAVLATISIYSGNETRPQHDATPLVVYQTPS